MPITKGMIHKMKNRFKLLPVLCLILVTVVLLPSLTAFASEAAYPEVPVSFSGEDMNMESSPLLIESTTYVPLFEFCMAIGEAEVLRDGDLETVAIAEMTIEAAVGNCYFTANERYLFVPTLCRDIDGQIYVPIRPLSKVFGLAVLWDDDTRSVLLEPENDTIESGETFYDETDVYWMSRIINAESGYEIMLGKIAVGHVVMNRVNSAQWPDTVYDVIFDNRYGIQFSPAYSGAINRDPNDDSVIAAKLALEGASVVGESIYFSATGLSSWASRNRPFIIAIGNHSFFG